MQIEEALEKLFSMKRFSVKLGLDNIRGFLEYLGNPEKKLKAFHIAGSNGKGSTASFISSILTEGGYKVGLYTSPHFVKFNERIRINGEQINDDYILNFLSVNEDYINRFNPTFFEITTAMAFQYFREKEVDYAVVETGLGGRLDATNVLDPLVSVITTISEEHSHILGDSIEKIAEEKAGIIKSGKPMITGFLPAAAFNVIRQKSDKFNSKILNIIEYAEIYDYLRLKIRDTVYNIYNTPLKGFHQIKNAGLAALIVKYILKNIPSDAVIKGINNVVRNTGIQGRYEIVNRTPVIIFDSAHNPEGIQALIDEFSKEEAKYEKKRLVFGAMHDKNLQFMIKLLEPHFNEFYFCEAANERTARNSELLEIAEQLGLSAKVLTDPENFLESLSHKSDNSCTVVTGSIYLLGEIKKKLILKKT